jgi:hypothetical protein
MPAEDLILPAHFTEVHAESAAQRALPPRPTDERRDGPPDLLHVIVPINNYVRYQSRYTLFAEFCRNMSRAAGVALYIVEVAFGERPFMVTTAGNSHHIQLRTHTVLWHKENSINLAVQRLPRDWKYVAWVDGDIQFLNPNFATETIQMLQHHKMVQMFESVANLGPSGETLGTHTGFGARYVKNGFNPPEKEPKYGNVWHPGFAWACTREAWNGLGGLVDFAILGAADHHMAWALIGAVEKSCPGGISHSYMRRLKAWQARADRAIQRNIGFVKGTIIHGWHGRFSDRKYIERWSIITGNGYDPDYDIKPDWQGLHTWDTPKYRLRDQVMQYFLERNEDTVDPPPSK